jgi:hypothetical protein
VESYVTAVSREKKIKKIVGSTEERKSVFGWKEHDSQGMKKSRDGFQKSRVGMQVVT